MPRRITTFKAFRLRGTVYSSLIEPALFVLEGSNPRARQGERYRGKPGAAVMHWALRLRTSGIIQEAGYRAYSGQIGWNVADIKIAGCNHFYSIAMVGRRELQLIALSTAG